MRALRRIVGSLVSNGDFARAMAARELKASTKGALLGLAWLVLQPFVQVVAYVVIVTFVFSAQTGEGGRFGYALHVLSGLSAWQLLQRTMESAPGLIRERIDIVRQSLYPIETLPLTAMMVAALGPAVALVSYLVLAIATDALAPTALLLPLPVALIVVLAVGLSWILMIAGVVLKDLREIITILFGLMIYASPVLLTPAMVGERLWAWVMFNPLSHAVVCVRDVLTGQLHPSSWAILTALAASAFVLGATVVHRTKVHINEYI